MPTRSFRVVGQADARLLLVLGLVLGAAGGYWLGSRRGEPPSVAPGPAAQGATPAASSGAASGGAPKDAWAVAPVTEAERAEARAAGLAWLAGAQEHDGAWDLVRWNPWHGRTGLHGFSEEDHWFGPAATGLALLAFLETTPPEAELPEGVRRGLGRLVEWQRDDGRIGFDEKEVEDWFWKMLDAPGSTNHGPPDYKARTIHTFNHAVAMAALALAAGRSDGKAWREGAQRALACTVADEHPEYRWSDYLDPESDIGVVAYVALAARAGADAGLVAETKPLLDALPDFLARVTDPATGRTHMLAEAPVCFDGDDSTAINAYARRLLGEAPDRAPLRFALVSLAAREPRWEAAQLPSPAGPGSFKEHLGQVVNHDAWTYGVRAMVGVAEPRATAWRATVRALLVRNQVRQGPQAGSWDPIGVWDRVGGRLYATAMAVRALTGP